MVEKDYQHPPTWLDHKAKLLIVAAMRNTLLAMSKSEPEASLCKDLKQNQNHGAGMQGREAESQTNDSYYHLDSLWGLTKYVPGLTQPKGCIFWG